MPGGQARRPSPGLERSAAGTGESPQRLDFTCSGRPGGSKQTVGTSPGDPSPGTCLTSILFFPQMSH